MGKLAKLIVVVAVIVVAGYAVVSLIGTLDDTKPPVSDQKDERPRLEEKYGFTSETVGD